MPCPLCGHAADRPSWLGSTRYRGRDFPYVECPSCHTLYCKPMPDGATLAAMYGVDYQSGFAHDEAIEDPKEPGASWSGSARSEGGRSSTTDVARATCWSGPGGWAGGRPASSSTPRSPRGRPARPGCRS